jgi:hypothetical protein
MRLGRPMLLTDLRHSEHLNCARHHYRTNLIFNVELDFKLSESGFAGLKDFQDSNCQNQDFQDGRIFRIEN